MISILLFVFFLLGSCKSFYFMSLAFHFSSFNTFMISISPLVCYVLMEASGCSVLPSESKLIPTLLILLVNLVSISYVVCNSYLYLVLLELTVPIMAALIMKTSKDLDKISSLFFMMLINLMGSVPFMVFLSLSDPNLFTPGVMMKFFDSQFIWICIFLVLMSKLPLFLFHFWLTKAHVTSSGCCSMILASLMLKLASYGMIKFSPFLNTIKFPLLWGALSIGLVGMLLITVIMIRFFDLKYAIASSSVLHMGSVTPMILLSFSSGVSSSLMMMVGHGLVSFILFLMVTLMYEFYGSRNSSLSSGIECFSKTFFMFYFIFLFLNLGIPPFVNFISELMFSFSMLKTSITATLLMILIMITGICFTMNLVTMGVFSKKSLGSHFTKVQMSIYPVSSMFIMATFFVTLLF